MATVDFTDAKRIVREYLLDRWTAANGSLRIADAGFQDDTHWRVVAGTAPVHDEDDEPPAAPVPSQDTAYLVDRSSGQLEVLPVAGNEERLAAMLPWG